MEDTWESASAKMEPDTVCMSLESNQTSNISLNHANMPMSLPTGTMTATQVNTGPGMLMETPQH